MGLWGKSRTVEDKPKFLPVDSKLNVGARENCIVPSKTTGTGGHLVTTIQTHNQKF